MVFLWCAFFGKNVCYSLFMEHNVEVCHYHDHCVQLRTPPYSCIVLRCVVQQTGHCDRLAIWFLDN